MAATSQKYALSTSSMQHQGLCGGGRFGSCLGVVSGNYGMAQTGPGITSHITGDITIEFWLYYSPAANRANWRGVFGNWGQATVANTGVIALMVGATQTIFAANGKEMFVSGTTRWTDGASIGWHHIAMVRQGSTWTVYFDGVAEMTGTDPYPNQNFNVNYLGLCNDSSGSPYNSGTTWVSEYRLTKAARYTAPFTPATAPFSLTGDPLASSVESLLHFNNTDTFDATTRNFFGIVGGASLNNAIYKFGANSMQFDGTSGYLQSLVNPDYFTTTTGGWTIDCWIYVTGTGGVILQGDSGGTTEYLLLGLQNGSSFGGRGLIPCFRVDAASTFQYLTDGTTQVTQNAWNHIEVDYDGTTAYLFLNGTLLKSQAMTMVTSLGDATIRIGANSTLTSTWYYAGMIDEFCITQGACRHTANFTPNTAAYDLATDPYKNNIVCLMHMESLPIVYPQGQPIIDQQDLYGGVPIVCQLVNPVSAATTLNLPAFSLSDPTAGSGLGEYPLDVIGMSYGNAMFQPDSYDTRTQTQQATDWNSFGGFIAGTCIEQATPLTNVTVDLMRNSDYLQYAQVTTDSDGTFVFNDIQLMPYDGYYSISANPNPAVLNQNAQIYSQMTATPYLITTTGTFTIGSGTTINSTVEIVGNMGPFTATLASGSLPPGATIQVNGRSISLAGATTLASTGYVFSLLITGSLRGYSSVIQFELTQPTNLSLGTIVMQDGSWMGCTTPVMGSAWTGFGGIVLFKDATQNRTDLLHFDGTAGPSPVVDTMGPTWAVYSGTNIILSSTQSVFGGTSWGGFYGATAPGSQGYIFRSGYNWPRPNNIPWTLEFWFYVTSSASAWQHLVGPYSSPNDMSLYVNGTNFYVYIGGAQRATIPITLGKWYFCVDQWDGTTHTTILNGTVVYTSNLNGPSSGNELMLNYNTNWSSGGIFVDELSIVSGYALYQTPTNPYGLIPTSTVPSTAFGTTYNIMTAW